MSARGSGSDHAPRILLKMPNWVGDCVMATPAIALLRRTFPDARIDALARRGPAGVLLDNGDLTSVVVADDRCLSPGERRRLRDAGYDAVALFPNSLRSAWNAWRFGIPRRVGFARGGRRLLLTHPLRFKPRQWQTLTPRPVSGKSIPQKETPEQEKMPGHMVSYYLAVAEETVRALGRSPEQLPQPELKLSVGAEAKARVEQLLEEKGLAGKLLIGLSPGAAYGNAKRYPLELVAAAANQLLQELKSGSADMAFVSTAAPGEAHLNEKLAGTLEAPLYRLGEELDLQGLAALLEHLAVLITNDSGAMHMAAATGTPIVAVFGPTDWNVTRPWSAAAQVVRESPACAPCFLRECPIDHRCMTAVAPEAVAGAAMKIMRS